MHPHEPAHIALNAQLLKTGQNYRSAGITNYIYQLVSHLSERADFRYTLWSGEARPEFGGMRQRITRLPVHRPAVRIFWEQALQPVEILKADPDLIHGMAFA